MKNPDLLHTWKNSNLIVYSDTHNLGISRRKGISALSVYILNMWFYLWFNKT